MRKARSIARAVIVSAFVVTSATACHTNGDSSYHTQTTSAYNRPCGPGTEPLPEQEQSQFVCQGGYWLPVADDLGN